MFYALLLTVLGFVLLQVLRFGEDHLKPDGYGPGDRSLSNGIPFSSGSPTAVHRTDDNESSAVSRPRRFRRIEVTAPERTSEKCEVITARDSSNSSGHKLQFDSDGFVVGDVTSIKALSSKIRGKKGL